MNKSLRKLLYILIATATISLLALGITILFKGVLCFDGIRGFKIEEKDVLPWIKANVSKELQPFKSVDKSSFIPLHKLISENKIKNLVYFKIENNKVSMLGDGGSRARKLKDALEKILELNRLNNLEF